MAEKIDLDDNLMLAVGQNPEDIKKQEEENIKKRETNLALENLAKAIFEKTKISIESAAQAVVPSIPIIVNEIAEEIQTGSVDNINISLDKLDDVVNKLGIDLGKYNKGLQEFAKQWKEKTIKSQNEVEELRKQGVVAEVDRYNEVHILSRREILERTEQLDQNTLNLETEKKLFEQDKKELTTKKKTEEQEKKLRESIIKRQSIIQKLEIERSQLINTLGSESEERKPGMLARGRQAVGRFTQGAGDAYREYTPDIVQTVIGTFTEGLMAPINAIKELGFVAGQFLRPFKFLLKLFKPLLAGFTSLIKMLGTAIISFVGLLASMLPFLAVVAAVTLGLGLLGYGIYKLLKFLGIIEDKEQDKKDRETGQGKYQSLDEGTYDAFNEGTKDTNSVIPEIKPSPSSATDTGDMTNNVINPNRGRTRMQFFKQDPNMSLERLQELKSNPPKEQMASSNVFAPQNVVTSNTSVTSKSLNGVQNTESWINKAIA